MTARRPLLALLAGLLVSPLLATVAGSAPARAEEVGLRFQPVSPPTRLVDTRGGAPLATDAELRIPVAGRAGVPAGTSAVTITLTVTEPGGFGWLDVRPCDTPYRGTSSINFEPGRTVANSVTAALGSGALCVRGLAPGGVHVVADLTGAWGSTGSGFASRTPTRVLDTRPSANPLRAGEDRAVSLEGLVPPDASAVAVQVTATEAATDGWLAAFPCATGWQGTSTVNLVAGSSASNLSLVGLAGGLCLKAMMGTHAVVDLLGWFGPDGFATFVPEQPTRLFDSRETGGTRPNSSILTVPGALPAGAVAAMVNVTTTGSQVPGFTTVVGCGTPLPPTSNGNYVPGVTQATAAVGAAGPFGSLCVLTSGATDLVVDRAGWFTADGPRPALGGTGVRLTRIATASAVTDLVSRPGDGTGLFVAERGGTVRRLELSNDTLSGALLSGLPGLVSGNETGLLGLAFAPGGATAYVNYTAQDAGGPLQTRVLAYSVAANGTFSAPRELLRFDQPFSNHNGGDLEVDTAGNLYIASGDGGSGGDPGNRAQDLGLRLGKILRIRPNAAPATGYTIPAGNPFAGVPGALPEIWAYGLRNPWRIDLDPVTGLLWIADVGQGDREEIDVLVTPGTNFGWRRWEGTRLFNAATSAPGATPPRHEYDHAGGGCSITGGFVYRGSGIPALAGAYVFSDFCAGGVRAIDPANPAAGAVLLSAGLGQASTFGLGPDGELYAATIGGAVFRVDP